MVRFAFSTLRLLYFRVSFRLVFSLLHYWHYFILAPSYLSSLFSFLSWSCWLYFRLLAIRFSSAYIFLFFSTSLLVRSRFVAYIWMILAYMSLILASLSLAEENASFY